MREDIQQIIRFVQHDPAAVAGWLFIGCYAALFFHILLKMTRAGYSPTMSSGWDLPVRYLRTRANHGWSPWPVYLLWPCLVLGIVLLVFGLFRL
jgi:hypothetical protein